MLLADSANVIPGQLFRVDDWDRAGLTLAQSTCDSAMLKRIMNFFKLLRREPPTLKAPNVKHVDELGELAALVESSDPNEIQRIAELLKQR